MHITQSIQPESYSRLLYRSFKLYSASIVRVFFLSLMLSIIIFIPRVISVVMGNDMLVNLAPNDPERIWLAVIDFLALIFFTGVLWRVECVITEAHESFLDDIKMALRKIPYIFVASILLNLIIWLMYIFFIAVIFYSLLFGQNLFNAQYLVGEISLFLLFFVPFFCFLYVFFEFYFFLPIILIENKGILASLKKSVILVWRNWWRVFKLQITPWLIYLICLVLLKELLGINIHVYFLESTKAYSILGTVFHIVLFAVFIPFVASTMIVQLHDLEVRKHRFD